MAKSDESLQIILSRAHDCQAVIAAVKVQRWDVVKWVVTVNSGLTAALIAIGHSRLAFAVLAGLAALMGIILVWHYNTRATKARNSNEEIKTYLAETYLDKTMPLACREVWRKTIAYDWQELVSFSICMVATVLPTIFVSLERAN